VPEVLIESESCLWLPGPIVPLKVCGVPFCRLHDPAAL
jgi:hypothetical protein